MLYRTIVADPPWPYKAQMRGSMTKGKQRSVPFDEYGTMTISEIAAMPVKDIASDGCHLYLWTTQAFMRDAYTVLDAWGFKQGAILVWSKPPKGVVGTWVCSAEFCIFARRGTLRHLRRHIGTVFQWQRGRHSAKPEAFRDLIEKVSPGPYLELFSRPWTPLFEARPGWDVWGNEVESDVAVASVLSGLTGGCT